MITKYISLGNNCEIGMALVKYGYDESSFLRYSGSSIDSLASLINNQFKDVFLLENLTSHYIHMLKDTYYDIRFHTSMKSKFNKEIKQWEFILKDKKQYEIYIQEKAKIEYLIKKWYFQVQNYKIIYFIKDTLFIEKKELIKLINAIKSLGSENFEIYYISLTKWKSKCINYNKIKHLTVSYVDYYAPIECAGKSDENNYKKIFKKIKIRRK
jgi:hypothetical protein